MYYYSRLSIIRVRIIRFANFLICGLSVPVLWILLLTWKSWFFKHVLHFAAVFEQCSFNGCINFILQFTADTIIMHKWVGKMGGWGWRWGWEGVKTGPESVYRHVWLHLLIIFNRVFEHHNVPCYNIWALAHIR